MRVYHFPEGQGIAQYLMLASDLLSAPVVHTGEWQAMDTSASKIHATHELEDVSLVWDRIPPSIDDIFPAIDQSWADDHFLERVSGQPLNPAPSHLDWPYAVRGNADHTNGEMFDHTYPERFWPKKAGTNGMPQQFNRGIRFAYGDLQSVVDLLVRSPLTRQAYLPVWFPEDTGAENGQRVPCTLGYHFMQRGGRLSMRYYLRSCDIYRHLSNDVWLAGMLLDWVAKRVTEATRGNDQPIRLRNGGMVIHISSLHSFVGDQGRMVQRMNQIDKMYGVTPR
jgi:hypothetical protein